MDRQPLLLLSLAASSGRKSGHITVDAFACLYYRFPTVNENGIVRIFQNLHEQMRESNGSEQYYPRN